jgi:hypothetical protein
MEEMNANQLVDAYGMERTPRVEATALQPPFIASFYDVFRVKINRVWCK